MNIRKVRETEAELVHEVLLENGRWMLASGIEQWPMDWLESIKDEVIASVAEGNFWCCEISDDIHAVVEVKKEAEELWGFDARPSAYVHKLAINRDHSGEGLGAKLLGSILEQAQSDRLDFVRLDCVASNTRLRHYYEGKGFQFVRIEHNGQVDLALYEKTVHKSE